MLLRSDIQALNLSDLYSCDFSGIHVAISEGGLVKQRASTSSQADNDSDDQLTSNILISLGLSTRGEGLGGGGGSGSSPATQRSLRSISVQRRTSLT